MKKTSNCRFGLLHILLLIAVISNFFTLYYLANLQHKIGSQTLFHDSEYSESGARNKTKRVQSEFTIVLRDFEDFENEVKGTVTSMQEEFAGAQIVVVSDDPPYPPLAVAWSNSVRLITLNGHPNMSFTHTQPQSFIKSKYVLILPDGAAQTATAKAALGDVATYMVSTLEEQSKTTRMVAWPLTKVTEVKCMKLIVNLKEWTLTYQSKSKSYTYCDGLQGTFALMLRSQDLLSLSAPFTKPMHTSLFVQTAMRHWHVFIDRKAIFKPIRPLFTDPHNNWKHKSLEFSHLKAAYAKFGIKLVQKDDEPKHWYGCTKETPRCFGTVVNSMAEYLYKGRWTPPCCLRGLRETTKHVLQILESQGVRYWLEGGSLLGAARNADIIPWDYDVDIGIYKEDISKSSQLLQCQNSGVAFEDESGFVWDKAPSGDYYLVHYSASNHLHVDIYPFHSRDGTMTKNTWMKSHRQDTEFPEHYLKPLAKIDFAGLRASAPNNVKDFLELKFGEGVVDDLRLPDGSNP